MHPVSRLKSTFDYNISGLLLSIPEGCLEDRGTPGEFLDGIAGLSEGISVSRLPSYFPVCPHFSYHCMYASQNNLRNIIAPFVWHVCRINSVVDMKGSAKS